jgi:hypothetical protein
VSLARQSQISRLLRDEGCNEKGDLQMAHPKTAICKSPLLDAPGEFSVRTD